MRHLFDRMGLTAVARRIWPRLLVEFRPDDDDGDRREGPFHGVREPRPGASPSGHLAGIALDEPADVPLAAAVGRRPDR